MKPAAAAGNQQRGLVKIRPISDELFAPFGRTHAAPTEAARIDYPGILRNLRSDAAPSLYTTLIAAREAPVQIELMERHRYSSQTFLPLSAESYLIIVAHPDEIGQPDITTACAFQVPGNAAITYAAGTWHHPMIALGRDAGFAVLMWLDGGPDDEEYFNLAGSFTVA